METKTLLAGLIGFFIGGLIVSTAATTFEKPTTNSHDSAAVLRGKSGDDFDAAFIDEMIKHHQSAVDMAQLSASQAKHPEIKTLSQAIITTQSAEIDQMKRWQQDWGYKAHDGASH